MQITRNNYEAYFLDYREKNLLPEQVAELMVFLEQNPDLKEEFESFENIVLVPEKNIRFNRKDSLKKNEFKPFGKINENNYEELMIADLEGNLPKEDSKNLSGFLSLNPHLKLEYNFFRSTFLKPDNSIIYKNKESLKKTGLFIIYRQQIVYALSVAASLLIFFSVYFGFNRKSNRQDTNISHLNFIRPELKTRPSGNFENRSDNKLADVVAQKNNTETKSTEFLKQPKMNGIKSKQIYSVEIAGNFNEQIIFINLRETKNTILSKNGEKEIPESVKKKSFAGRFIAGLAGKFINTKKIEKKSFLEYTVEGYNLMADKEVTIEKELDENGKVVAYNVNGETVKFFKLRRK